MIYADLLRAGCNDHRVQSGAVHKRDFDILANIEDQ
jgi:hypothetical protein